MAATLDTLSQPPSQSSSPSALATTFQTSQSIPSRALANALHVNRPLGSAPGTPTTPSHPSAILEPPPGVKFADYLRSWSDAHVSKWLADIKCAHHASTFKASDIRSDVLLELDQVTLKEMGITSIGDRLRILNAVKALRQKCSTRRDRNSLFRPRVVLDISQTESAHRRSDSSTLSPASRTSTRRPEHGRPPPLQLNSNVSNSTNLPHLIRDSSEQSRSSNVRPLPFPQPTVSIPTNLPLSQANTPSSSHPTRANHLPLPPVPRGQPPPPPPSSSSRTTSRGLLPTGPAGRRTPTQEFPEYTSQPLPPAPGNQSLLTPVSAQSQSQPSSWSPYGLPSDPRAGLSGSKTPIRSQSPLPSIPPRSSNRSPNRPANTGLAHGRNLSASSVQTGSNLTKLGPRPSTSGHPYSQNGLQPPAPLQGNNALSPIVESFSPHAPSSAISPSQAFAVGRGPFSNRPTTPQHSQAPSLVDLRRKLVKFQLADEGHSATINVEDCSGGIEVLEKALKKFNKLGNRSTESLDASGTEDGGLSVDGWGVYLDWGNDSAPATSLTEGQLLAICHTSPDDPARERGLTLRRMVKVKNPDDSDKLLSPYTSQPTARSTKRASTVSILSGLGVPNPEKIVESPGSPVNSNDDVTDTHKPSKLRNFLGQRPPSELITNHLREYFPTADKKVLNRTARHSVLRAGGGKRDSTWSFNPGSSASSRFSVSTLGSQRRASHRASVASLVPPPVPEKAFGRPLSTTPAKIANDVEPPRVSLSADDGSSVDIESEDEEQTPQLSTVTSHLLPPVNFSAESFSETLNNTLNPSRSRPLSTASTPLSKRLSYVTELRSKRDVSDTASLMTMDEITAEVESRSQGSTLADTVSMIDGWTKVDADDEVNDNTPITPVDIPPEGPEDGDGDEYDDDEEEEEEDEEDEDEEEEEEEEEDGTGKAIASGGIKWIKGALIGSGSFGKVYLGMDASNGLLMAVKQVEVPSASMNNERKKSMIDALEREIELLKDLEHEHIVQYLYSSSDEEHFNIFLEYVPGGSVTALLRNYGAFEEPLVRTFVRQILEGLDYVHERGIVHRDIKGANVLVDNKGGIKISDFGISKKLEDNLMPGNRLHRPSLQGSVFWMAPEVVKQTAYTKKADIWSVGCLVVEMFTGDHPWAQLNQMQAIFKIGSFSAKPPIPSDISADAQNFLELCFELDHEARPSAGDLLKHIWLGKKVKGSKKDAPATAQS
ncbi:hypothetical protein OF83DRAFT_905882 [Amylostereum chailletii]|nr:hypothetical protein OF83DRAFT_905882 [Amylostereum chailletii]